jgi:hypothetical protein
MSRNNAKPWTDKNGHWLGQIVRVRVYKAGRKYHEERLNLFRHAIDVQAESPEEIDILAVLAVKGTAPVVKCDVPGCNEMRAWFKEAN